MHGRLRDVHGLCTGSPKPGFSKYGVCMGFSWVKTRFLIIYFGFFTGSNG